MIVERLPTALRKYEGFVIGQIQGRDRRGAR
jgi:hypothetical protein